jgi:cobaltochelatase CobS
MSPRTVLTWAENADHLRDRSASRSASPSSTSATSRAADLVAEFYQRCFGVDLVEAAIAQK